MQVRRARGSILAAMLGLAVLPAALPLGLPVAPQAVDAVVDLSGAAGTLLVVRHAGTAPVTVDTTVLTGPAVRGWWVDGATGENVDVGDCPGVRRHAPSPDTGERRPRLDARDRRHDPRARSAPATHGASHARRRGHTPRVGSAEWPRSRWTLSPRRSGSTPPARAHRSALRHYVDDGLLAGLTVAVSRRGRVVHLSTRVARSRRRAAGDGRHDLAHLLDDEADHVGRSHDALRRGCAGADRPGGAFHPVLRRRPRLQFRAGAEPVDGPGHRAVRVWHLLTTRPGSPTASTTRTPSMRCTA